MRTGSGVTWVDAVGRGRDVSADEERLRMEDLDIALFELCATGAQALDLPTGQYEPGLVAILDMVVVARLLVEGNGRAAVGLFLGLGHPVSVKESMVRVHAPRGRFRFAFGWFSG